MNKLKSFPEDMPEWQAIQDTYNQRNEGDVPYLQGMAPQEPVMDPSIDKSNFMPAAQEEANDQQIVPDIQDLSGPIAPGVVESGQVSQQAFDAIRGNAAPEVPMSPQEKMMSEYKAMQDQDRKALEDARSSDRNLKMGGAIGDALATIVNARGQMNVKAPGVQVQQGAGLGKIADMFATAPDAAADIKSKREDLLAQYKMLSKGNGDMTPYQKAFLAMKEKDQALREKGQEGVMSRHGDTLGFKKEEKNELSDKQLEGIVAFDKVQELSEDLKNRAETFKDKLGPYASKIERTKSAIPGLQEDPDFAAFRASANDQMSQYIKSLSGLTVSDKERAALLESVPTVEDKYDIFMSKMTEMQKRLSKLKNQELKAAADYQGKSVKTTSAQESTSVSKDEKALRWAKANPNDPRSVAILKKLGM